ncbi:MAG TPA: SRPBCC family protein [Nitrolancea sp.]|jgi:uncharacterized membrane protein|nr:SRPBCC family protein [Nitrolancea sp.]
MSEMRHDGTSPERLARVGVSSDAVTDQHQRAVRSGRHRASTTIRWLPIISGIAVAGYGLSRRSKSGLLLASVAGGAVTYGIGRRRAHDAPDGEHSIRIEKVITINKPVEEVYRAWSKVTDLPRILSHLQSVTDLGQGKSHWVANAPLGKTVEWDAETMVDQENRVISWRSTGETAVQNVGAVRFQEAPNGRGTELRVRIEYNVPFGTVGSAVAKLFGEEPGQQVEDDLRRFKQMLETGEVATTEGQSRAGSPSSRMDAGMDKVRQFADAAASVVGNR